MSRALIVAFALTAGPRIGFGAEVNHLNDKPPADAVAVMQSFAATAMNPALHPWASFSCGSALWGVWAAKDPSLGPKGKQIAGGGRAFSKFANSDVDLYKSAAFQSFMKPFINAPHARIAAAAERERIGSMMGQPFSADKSVSVVEAGGVSLAVYHEKDSLWIELASALPKAVAGAPAVSSGTAGGAKPASVETIYTVDKLRDPFLKSALGGVSSKPFSPDDFSIHNLALRGVMKDQAADYALFTDNSFGVTFILRRGKLYDGKGKPVPGVTGSMNLKQKTAHLMTQESDVQTFRLGEEGKD
ncbi:MAG: hypothetical protein HY077_01715 [Elusimicrobia bacterium]|nr:hypothetical protein [Elusimicrobiota bacterium]